jgi:hypothetical protein
MLSFSRPLFLPSPKVLTENILKYISNHSSSLSSLNENIIFSSISSSNDISIFMNNAIAENVEDLYSIGLTDNEIKEDLQKLIFPTIKWIWIASCYGSLTLSKDFNVHANYHDLDTNPLINRSYDNKLESIVSIEESIHSPMLGIKGQVDLIGKGRLFQLPSEKKNQVQENVLSEMLLPIELKTGKWRPSSSVAHRAQVILYILLLNIREKSLSCLKRKDLSSSSSSPSSSVSSSPSKYGLLLYLNENEIKVDFIWPMWNEIKSLMISRNLLAKSINDSICSVSNNYLPILPSMLKSSFECTYCYSASECMIYHASLEDGNEETSGIPLLYSYIMKGMNSKHLSFFKYWDKLIDLESKGSVSSSSPSSSSSSSSFSSDNGIWNVSSIDRERNGGRNDSSSSGGGGDKGKTLSLLSLKTYNCYHVKNNQIDETIELQFQRISSSSSLSMTSSLTNEFLSSIQDILSKDFTFSQIIPGERVMISLEKISSWLDQHHPQQSLQSNNRSSSLSYFRKLFNRSSKALMSIDANICSGTVLSVSSDTITISLTAGIKSMKS